MKSKTFGELTGLNDLLKKFDFYQNQDKKCVVVPRKVSLSILEYIIKKTGELSKVNRKIADRFDKLKERICDEVWLTYLQKEHIDKIVKEEKRKCYADDVDTI